MCELFALSSKLPTTIGFSLPAFAAHGGPAGHNVDGWGIAAYDGHEVRLLKEPEPAGKSEWIAFVAQRRQHSRLVLSHIRRATRGAISLANTQPFLRELGGRAHVFAHNGRLPGIERLLGPAEPRFRPIGETDSELAFCLLLERMAPLWTGMVPPPLENRLAVLRNVAAALRPLGPANFLYADSDALFAHGHQRMQRDGRIAPPGLFRLERRCDLDRDALPEAGVLIGGGTAGQELTIVASVPLSDEPWLPLREGEILVLRDGLPALPP